MKNKSNHSFLLFLFGGIIAALILLGFIVFPFIKASLTMPHYVPAQELTIQRDFHSSLFMNDTLNTHIFSNLLIQKIRESKNTIHAAVYSIDSQEIRDELYSAANRGVTIELVLDYKKHSQHAAIFANPPKNFSIHEVNTGANTNAQYMHHKFAIFDENTKDRDLLTGAWNWTILQEMIDPTFVFQTQDTAVIDAYSNEFKRLNSGNNGTKKFTVDEYRPFARKLIYENCFVEIWFSPGIEKNSIKQRIIDLIETSKSDIKMMVWRVTDVDIAQALRKKAEDGIHISIITDDYNVGLYDSVFRKYRELLYHDNIEIITDAKRKITWPTQPSADLNSFLHHHMMIVDKEIVIFGTNNWSERGHYKNDENIIVTDNTLLVKKFEKSYLYHFRALASK